METAFAYVELLIESVTAEVFGVGFLAGCVVFLLGLCLFSLFALSRILGYRTEGKVLGYVEVSRTKQRERDGQRVEVEKKTLYPIYEYKASDGTLRQMRGSEGGTMVRSYTTGQLVNLIVREDTEYDDVYDAQKHAVLFIAIVFMAVGVGVMGWIGSLASAFGVTALSCALGLLFFFARALTKQESQPNQAKRERKAYNKSFDPNDVRPIESLST